LEDALSISETDEFEQGFKILLAKNNLFSICEEKMHQLLNHYENSLPEIFMAVSGIRN
jgi:hypothetical protein